MEHFGVVHKFSPALVLQKLHVQLPDRTLLGLLLGPLVGLTDNSVISQRFDLCSLREYPR
jgi:hypothetical protein